MTTHTFDVRGRTLKLDSAEGVFMPSPNGSFYANSICVSAGERVIDIGTGSGILAIYAALEGATTCATDIHHDSVTLARHNAILNGASVDVREGRLFADFNGPFDVILANLPNEIVPAAHVESVGDDAITFAGGRGGIEHILDLLNTAPAYMHSRSRLYLAVHTLTDYHATLSAALAGYIPTLVSFAELPAKPFVKEYIDLYRRLNEQGVIRIVRRGDDWFTLAYVYELRLR